MPKLTILSGGIGGAKLIEGFYNLIATEPSLNFDDIAIIANTGDDFLWYNLRVCPDIDIIIYTLSNLINREKGWGLKNDSFNCLEFLKNYDNRLSWFNLGDKDLATAIYRTNLLNNGMKLSQITKIISEKLKIKIRIYPMAENYMPTMIETIMPTPTATFSPNNSMKSNLLHFEEYLVKYNAKPKIKRIIYGAQILKNQNKQIIIPENVELFLKNSEKIIIAPSNPLLSIFPIIKIPFYKKIIEKKRKNVIAISPLISSKSIKGPLVQNLIDLGLKPNVEAIAKLYSNFVSTLIIDKKDALDINSNKKLKDEDNIVDIKFLSTNILLNSLQKKINLAKFIIHNT
ncbi:MAG: 2-phospho-L-lactate transferase CofD family protein [Promethearchaeota archaeon]